MTCLSLSVTGSCGVGLAQLQKVHCITVNQMDAFQMLSKFYEIYFQGVQSRITGFGASGT